MKCFAYYKKIDDWRRKTAGLPLLQRGVYGELLDWYYATGKPLPDDLDELCRMIGATKKSERAAVDKVVGNPVLFTRKDGLLVQNTVEENLLTMTEKNSQARAAAKARWNKNNDLQHAFALPPVMPNASDGNATHNPLPNKNLNTPLSVSGTGLGIKNSGRGGIQLRAETLQAAKRIATRADVHSLEAEWRKSRKDPPRDPDAAFLGWVRSYVKNHTDLA